MPRLISMMLTEDAIVEQRKTETRRLGWWLTKAGHRMVLPGDTLTACRKVMGRRPGEPLLRLTDLIVTGVRRERLDAITPDGVLAEGVDPARFDELDPFTGQPTPAEWVRWFCAEQGCTPDTIVTVITWRYPDKDAAPC